MIPCETSLKGEGEHSESPLLQESAIGEPKAKTERRRRSQGIKEIHLILTGDILGSANALPFFVGNLVLGGYCKKFAVSKISGKGATDAILSGSLGMGKGMLYEALIADALYKRGGRLFYFAKESGLELDFVINYIGTSTILEVKARDGNTNSL